MIELNNFTYKTNRILFKGANFIAPSIGIIGIAGESGCGKTTFLKIISKQIHLDSMVNDATSIFYGNQDALLKKDLTIAQQFELIESIYNREHNQNTIDELFNSLNIKASLSQKYDSCSLGEKKRIMIALSVYSNSPCIILDEPLSSVDYEDKHSIMKLLKEHSHDRVIILTIHDEEFDDYLDIKYLIENLQFTRIKDTEINGEPLSMTQEFTPKRIAHVKSKKEKFSILLYALLCLVIINMTLYSGIELYMTNKNTASMMDNLTSKIIYTGKEYITRNELPSGYKFMEYDQGFPMTTQEIQSIQSIKGVKSITSYYQFPTRNYDTRNDEDDNLIAYMSVKGREYSTDDNVVVSSYLKGQFGNKNKNYISEGLMKTLELTDSDFPVTMKMDIGVPVCSTEYNGTIRYGDQNGLQKKSYDVIERHPVYQKKRVSIKIYGVIKSNEDQDDFTGNNALKVYLNNDFANSIINKYRTTNVSISLYEDLNEHIVDYVPATYAVECKNASYVDQVRNGLNKISPNIVTYIESDDYKQTAKMRQKDSKNTKTMILIYTVVGLIAYVVFLILYNKSREYIRYRELDLNEKQIQSIHMVDIQFMSTFLFIAVLLSFCLRLFTSSEFALVNNSIKMIIGLVSAVVTTLVFYITNKIMVTSTDHD